MNSCSITKVAVSVSILLFLISEPSSARRYFRGRGQPSTDPYVIFYEHESFRGAEYVAKFKKECVNLPQEYMNWASSVDTHRSCASVCELENCQGACVNVHSNQGVSKLRLVGLNDRIKSVKNCYSF